MRNQNLIPNILYKFRDFSMPVIKRKEKKCDNNTYKGDKGSFVSLDIFLFFNSNSGQRP